ncbi:glutamine-hydrolyzing GMP synthase [bacterium]|nr:glutamine-hydrolyzing GMP synthase [bacterium]
MRGPKDDLVLILDFGAQYARLIARRVREARVYCEIIPFDTPVAEIAARQPKALILSGGPESVLASGNPRVDRTLWDLGLPMLGICYGMQLMAHDLGGRVEPGETAEFGRTEIERTGPSTLFGDLQDHLVAWMSHRDTVVEPPDGFTVIAKSRGIPVAAMQHEARRLYGIQFHAEVTHTPWGSDLIRRFVLDIAGCGSTWTPGSVAKMSIANIRRQVGDEQVLCALSGGVDSVTVAVLLKEAIGDKVVCVFIDHGLLREGERDEVESAFREEFNIPLHVLDARERFLSALDGIVDPEEKRKTIGTVFVRVFEEFAKSFSDIRFLAQGTLYPDVIESQSGTHGPGAKIKSHHNVGGMPDEMGFDELVEPLRFLFKDEVREVALEMGVPHHMAYRQPFPGPGLAIRIVGEITPERLKILRQADAIVRQEVESVILEEDLWQYFAVLPAIKTVGVTGDHRNYGYVAAIRCVTSTDGMTSDFPELPWSLLRKMSNRIMNEVSGISRVVYDISTKPPATIEWE